MPRRFPDEVLTQTLMSNPSFEETISNLRQDFKNDLSNIENDLSNIEKRLMMLEGVTSPIFRSSLFKGAADCLFWSRPSLMDRHVSPAEIQLLCRLTEVLGGTRDKKGQQAVKLFKLDAEGNAKGKDAVFIAKAKLPRKGTKQLAFLDPLTYRNVGDLGDDILDRLRSDVSISLHVFSILNLRY